VVELLQGNAPAAPPEALEEQLDRIRRKIARLVEVLASGPEDLPSVRGTVAALERERERLERDLDGVRVERRPGGQATLEGTVDQLLESLQSFRQVLQAGSPAEPHPPATPGAHGD
jgi:alkanesulfonate monooxygenase SsuD/methylene tetrahydromethanopterin reductase-like flavin-dependent oxidoreductase (luciferase family)